MDCSDNVYTLLFKAISVIPVSHYALGLSVVLIVILYNFLEFHLVEDLLTGFRGSTVSLTYNSCSEIYEGVASKCKILHGRYLATPWLSSPHIQTTFLNFFGRPPAFTYRRQLFHASDGGTIALDWLLKTDVSGDDICQNSSMSKDDTTPIMVVIPGLTSDSASAYLKHLAFDTAKQGWNVVISNHRGLGGISVTSDCFYNAGWTEDTRAVIEYLHHKYTKAPLFAIGTSIGANILVKYLGEHGENVPVAGAVAICSPWDLLVSLLLKVPDTWTSTRGIACGCTVGDYTVLYSDMRCNLWSEFEIKQDERKREYYLSSPWEARITIYQTRAFLF